MTYEQASAILNNCSHENQICDVKNTDGTTQKACVNCFNAYAKAAKEARKAELKAWRSKQDAQEDELRTVAVTPSQDGFVLAFAHRKGYVAAGGGMANGLATFSTADTAKQFAREHNYLLTSQ